METIEPDDHMELNRLLSECVARDASDLHLVPGMAPHFRYHGELLPVGGWPALAAAGTRALAVAMLARAFASRRNRLDLDAALAQRGSVDGALSAEAIAKLDFESELGEIIENSLRKQIIIGDGSGMGFLTRPVSALVLTVAALTFLWPMISKQLKRGKA